MRDPVKEFKPAGYLITRDAGKLQEAGCQLVDPIEMFLGIYIATRGNCCDGCAYLAGGKCPAFQRYHTQGIATQNRKQAAGHVEHGCHNQPVRERCPKCGLKIRGENHEAHCQPRKQ